MANDLLGRVTHILEESFEDVEDHLEKVAGSNRIMGFVVSPSFRRKTDQQRQKMLWKELEARLSPQELAKLGAIVVMTPEEAELRASDN